jgi:hypothetical protein
MPEHHVQHADRAIGPKDEEWRKVDGWPNYEVSTFGRVRSKGFRILKLVGVQGGGSPNYRPLHVSLSSPGKQVWSVKVAVLVLLAFVGPPPFKGAHALHWDDDQGNNNLSNLRWGTSKDNASDRLRNGKSTRGELNGNSILTQAIVDKIKAEPYKRYSKTANLRTIAEKYGISLALVHTVISGSTWEYGNG